MTYLVDTDVLIDYLRNVEGAADYLDSIGEWTYSVITAMELITKCRSRRKSDQGRAS
jgi:predicted nucleic acid-binding protein